MFFQKNINFFKKTVDKQKTMAYNAVEGCQERREMSRKEGNVKKGGKCQENKLIR